MGSEEKQLGGLIKSLMENTRANNELIVREVGGLDRSTDIVEKLLVDLLAVVERQKLQFTNAPLAYAVVNSDGDIIAVRLDKENANNLAYFNENAGMAVKPIRLLEEVKG